MRGEVITEYKMWKVGKDHISNIKILLIGTFEMMISVAYVKEDEKI